MKVLEADASSRFDTTSFSNVVADGRALPLVATYICPDCAEQVGFQKSYFEDRAELQHSNLQEQVQRAFNQRAALLGKAGLPFLDWACPGCKKAVRVYAEPWAGGRHGDSGIDLVLVLEHTPGSRAV